MAIPEKFRNEKLIISVIYRDERILEGALDTLFQLCGECDAVSEELSFSLDYSSYYDDELGGAGKRKIYSFKKLVSPDTLAAIKLKTNEIEASYARKINLDPGILNDGRLLLASAKPLGFRVALKDGIYGDYTLFYARGAFHKLPWTYRDYQSDTVLSFLISVRKEFIRQRRLGE